MLTSVLVISHDERFINSCLRELWVCEDGTVKNFYGSVTEYKRIIVDIGKKRLAEAQQSK